MFNNFDWQGVGEDIRRTVQDAIDSRDFRMLNQTISDTVNQFTYRRMDRPIVRPEATLYAKTTQAMIVGLVLTILGCIFSGAIFIALVCVIAVGIIDGTSGEVWVAFAILAFLLLDGIIMASSGIKKLGSIKRFHKYIQEMRGRDYCDIKQLAHRIQKTEKYVLKDVKKMIEKGWFIQGYLDNQEKCLMTSEEAYREYQALIRRMEEQRAAKEQEKAWEEKREDTRKNLEPQVQEIIEEGMEYVRKIRRSNDAIPGEVVSEKISRMEILVQRIFERVEQSPEAVSDIRRLMEYYLPTVVKLLEAYEDLDTQPIQGPNIISAKKEIEDTLDTLNIAFEKLLDDMFQDTAWDVSSDISVLRTMLAQEGLTEDVFRTGGKS